MPDRLQTPVPPQMLMRSFPGQQGKLILLYGEEPVFRFSTLLMAQAAYSGLPVAVIDGCNRFNVHALVRYAQQKRANPDLLLSRVYISRGFTCYQMEAAIGRLPLFLGALGARAGIVLGLLDTFYDEQAPFREVREMLHRIIGELQRMRESGLSVLLCNFEWNVLPPERNMLLYRLKQGVDTVYRLTSDGDGSPRLFFERPPGGGHLLRGENYHG